MQDTDTDGFYEWLEPSLTIRGYKKMTRLPPSLDLVFEKLKEMPDPGGRLVTLRWQSVICVLQAAKTTKRPAQIAEGVRDFFERGRRLGATYKMAVCLLFVFKGGPPSATVIEEIQKIDVKITDGNITAGAFNTFSIKKWLSDEWRLEIFGTGAMGR